MIIKKAEGVRKGSILAVMGVSMYNVLRVALNQVTDGFAKRGYEVSMLDITNENDLELLCEEIVKPYSMIFSMQACLFELKSDNEYLIDIIKTPFYGWIFDDVIFHMQRIEVANRKNTVLFSMDSKAREHIGYYAEAAKRIQFMPHGGLVLEEDNITDKDIDILFPGTIGDYPSKDEFEKNALPIEVSLANESIELMKKYPQISVRGALKEVLGTINEELTDELMKELEDVIIYISLYIRTYFRNELLNELLKSGYNIHLIGNNNSQIEYPSNVTLHGPMDIIDNMRLMKKSKIIMNPVPNVIEGGYHERIFTGLLSKAVIFSPYSPYVNEKLGDRIEYIDLNNLSDMMQRISDTLDNWDAKREYIENNYIYVKEQHTFEKRGEQIIDHFENNVAM